MTIQFAIKAPGMIHEQGAVEVARLFLLSFIDPFGTLWFIYLLLVFFVFIKLTRRVPVPIIWLFGVALEIAHINTGWMVPDEFAARFVYCHTGYIFAKPIFALTAAALMAESDVFKPLRYCGRNSIIIYLAFFLPMAATRDVLQPAE